MTWRVHLTDGFIPRLDLLPGQPEVLCAWLKPDTAAFFDLSNGMSFGRQQFSAPSPDAPEWPLLWESLIAPNRARLPFVQTPQATLYSNADGSLRLVDDGHGISVLTPTQEKPLVNATPFVAVALARNSDVMAAIDDSGRLMLCKGNTQQGIYNIGLAPEVGTLPEVTITPDAQRIIASDGQRLVSVNPDGTVNHTLITDYAVGRIACSDDGAVCLTADPETGVLRAYSADDLSFTHQKFAIDLFAAARQLQLMAELPTPRLAVSALALNSAGVVAFAMDGMVTVTHLARFDAVPEAALVPSGAGATR
jgi:hypothetical protein